MSASLPPVPKTWAALFTALTGAEPPPPIHATRHFTPATEDAYAGVTALGPPGDVDARYDAGLLRLTWPGQASAAHRAAAPPCASAILEDTGTELVLKEVWCTVSGTGLGAKLLAWTAAQATSKGYARVAIPVAPFDADRLPPGMDPLPYVGLWLWPQLGCTCEREAWPHLAGQLKSQVTPLTRTRVSKKRSAAAKAHAHLEAAVREDIPTTVAALERAYDEHTQDFSDGGFDDVSDGRGLARALFTHNAFRLTGAEAPLELRLDSAKARAVFWSYVCNKGWVQPKSRPGKRSGAASECQPAAKRARTLRSPEGRGSAR